MADIQNTVFTSAAVNVCVTMKESVHEMSLKTVLADVSVHC